MRFGGSERVGSQPSLRASHGTRGSRVVRTSRYLALIALALALSTAIAAASTEGQPRVDINRASVEELMSLPGVGPAKAKAIVEHRQTAPFKKTEELLEVRGIGDSIYADLRDRITVSEAEDTSEGEGTAPDAPGAVAAERK